MKFIDRLQTIADALELELAMIQKKRGDKKMVEEARREVLAPIEKEHKVQVLFGWEMIDPYLKSAPELICKNRLDVNVSLHYAERFQFAQYARTWQYAAKYANIRVSLAQEESGKEGNIEFEKSKYEVDYMAIGEPVNSIVVWKTDRKHGIFGYVSNDRELIDEVFDA